MYIVYHASPMWFFLKVNNHENYRASPILWASSGCALEKMEKLRKPVRGRASVWPCFSLWPWDKVGLLWQKRTSIAGTLSDSQYSEVPSLFTGAQEEPLNTPKPEGFGLSL
jgi:hypothetical protein